MSNSPSDRRIVFQTRDRRQCREIELVLSALNVSCEIQHLDGVWSLRVPEPQIEHAKAEIESYVRENRKDGNDVPAHAPRYGGAFVSVLIYTATLIIIGVVHWPWGLGANLLPAGQLDTALVRDGQWWRVITALTLHDHPGHLAANIAFGSLFGILVSHMLGGGIAWLCILAGGIAGNFINAMVQSDNHISIGASTAVFAALGLLVAHNVIPSTRTQENLMRRWSPLVAGLVLFAMTGIGGPKTDTAAHVFGFLAGIAIGVATRWIPHRIRQNLTVQWIAGIVALATVSGAWWVALTSALEA